MEILVDPPEMNGSQQEAPVYAIGSCCLCGGDTTDVGAHGVQDRQVYSEYYCDKCYWNVKFRGARRHA